MAKKLKKAPSLFLKMTFPLRDSFEAAGSWWLPEATNGVTGTLRYSHSDVELELNDSLESLDVSEIATLGNKFVEHPCIHGKSNEGKKFTLLKSHATSVGSTAKYSPIYLLVGAHTTDAASLRFSSMSFCCSQLDDFVACRGMFDVKHEKERDELKVATISYIQPKMAAWRIPSISATLEIDIEPTLREGRMNAEISAQSVVRLRPESPQDLDWYLTKIWRFMYLLTLLTDEPVVPSGIRVFLNGDRHPYWLLYRTKKELADEDESLPVLLFHLGHLVHGFRSILDKWFSVDDTLLDAIHLTMDAHRNPDQTFQGRFLLLAHAAEVFSRATTPSGYLNDNEYEPIKKAIIAAIPPSVQGSHKDSLKSRIKYGNEYAFHKRVTLLVESLSEPAQAIVCRDPKAFARGVAASRNYYTHFTDELRMAALPRVAMYWAGEKLLLLMRILLLRHLGVDETLVVKQLREHHRLMQRIFLSKEHPETAPGAK